MVDNTLALHVKPMQMDFATPLLTAAKLRAAQVQEEQTRMVLGRAKLGEAAAEIMASPEAERPVVWARKADELAQQGLISPQQHAQWRDNYSPLAAQQLLARSLGAEKFIAYQQQQEGNRIGVGIGNALGSLFGGQDAPAPASTPDATVPVGSTQPMDGGPYAKSIASIESGGNYNALGPLITGGKMAGDRAYGKYQVMGSNVGPWTKEVLGQELTPQQFLASPQAQDAVFNAKFGALAQKYGPEGASRAWFAGEGGMNNLGRKDQLGTTVGQYGQKFSQAQGVTDDRVQRAVPMLLQAVAHPNVPAGAKDAAKVVLEWAKEDRKLTNDQKEWAGHVRDEISRGKTPLSFTEYQLKMKEAGRAQVNVDQRQESKFAEELGKGLAKQFNDMAEDGIKASDDVRLAGRLGQLLERSGTGANVAFTNWVRQTVGPEIAGRIGANASEAEAADALISYMKPRMRVPGSGASTDKDMDIFGRALPSLLSTPEGKRVVVETIGGMAQARQMRGGIAMRVQMGELTPKQAIEEMRKQPDPFASFRSWQGAQGGKAGAQSAKPSAEVRFKELVGSGKSADEAYSTLAKEGY